MNRIISTSVTPEQYEIIKQMADTNNMTISQYMKESVQVTTALSYISNTLAKIKWDDITQDAIDRNAKIMEHAQEMVKLMQPHFEKALSAIPKDMMKTLEDDGRELRKGKLHTSCNPEDDICEIHEDKHDPREFPVGTAQHLWDWNKIGAIGIGLITLYAIDQGFNGGKLTKKVRRELGI